jgi:hypothetical protein
MKKHCYRCHGVETQEADLSLHDLTRVVSDSADAINWQDILDKLNAGEMPPEDEPQPNRTRKWMQLYSDFIDLLRSSRDPLDPNGGTIFDNSLVYFGGGLRTAHRNTNIPCLLTGGGFNGLTHGQHRTATRKNTPLANLWTTMLQDAGAPIDRFADADSTMSAVWG